MALADDYPMHLENELVLEDLVRAIMQQESGRRVYSKRAIAEGVRMARSGPLGIPYG